MTYKRIMVSIDGSQTSGLVLKEAINLTKDLHANLCIMHVADAFPAYNMSLGIDFDRYIELIRQDSQVLLNKMKEIAQTHGVDAETSYIEINDVSKRISEKIIEVIKSWHADLLVIGTHGRHGFNRLILGSVAEETIRMSPIPVLLIRTQEKI